MLRRATFTRDVATLPSSQPVPRPNSLITGKGNHVTTYKKKTPTHTSQYRGPKNAIENLGGLIAAAKLEILCHNGEGRMRRAQVTAKIVGIVAQSCADEYSEVRTAEATLQTNWILVLLVDVLELFLKRFKIF